MEFDSGDGAERVLGGEQQHASFAAAEIEQRVVLDCMAGQRGTPACDSSVEERGSRGIVAFAVLVVSMASGEAVSVEEAAGIQSGCSIPGMDGLIAREQRVNTRAKPGEEEHRQCDCIGPAGVRAMRALSHFPGALDDALEAPSPRSSCRQKS